MQLNGHGDSWRPTWSIYGHLWLAGRPVAGRGGVKGAPLGFHREREEALVSIKPSWRMSTTRSPDDARPPRKKLEELRLEDYQRETDRTTLSSRPSAISRR